MSAIVYNEYSERCTRIDENWKHAGTVSYGTMREEDLIPAFIEQLHYMGKHREANEAQEEWDKLSVVAAWFEEEYTHTELRENNSYWRVKDTISWLLNEDLFDQLNELAAPGYYFGSHMGDGADFGFWIHEDYELYV